jgi:transposase
MKTQIPLFLKPEQRQTLEQLIRTGSAPARTQTRARILLLTDRSTDVARSDEQVAEALGCSQATVGNIRRRCIQEGLQAALEEKPRPGRVPKLTGDLEAQLTVLACSTPPEGAARWTVRLLADQMVELGLVDQIHHTTVWGRMKKTNSSPGKYKPGASASPRPNT